MTEPVRFIPLATLDAQANLGAFIELVRTRFTLLRANNRFEDFGWSVEGLVHKGGTHRFVYFTQAGVEPKNYYSNQKRVKGHPAEIPEDRLLRGPFCNFAKAMLAYLHAWETSTALPDRLGALRHLETALHELNGTTCPTAATPEVLNLACRYAAEAVCSTSAYARGKQLEMIYRYMVELGLLAVPTDWVCPLKSPERVRNRVGERFDAERQKKLPSPQALEALGAIFSSDSNDPREIFASSACALMLCDPDRSVEVLFAPQDILAPDWTDPKTGEIGSGLRWYPAKGAAPMIKTVIPSMRDIAARAVARLRQLSAPARALARWYEQQPDRLYLPPQLEYLRGQKRLDQDEIHAVLFGGDMVTLRSVDQGKVRRWLDSMGVPRVSPRGGVRCGTSVDFADLERGVLSKLPEGFPIMDPKTGMRYSEALCLAREGEFNSNAASPSQCCFDRIRYQVLRAALQSHGAHKSIFEKRGIRDEHGKFLYLRTHMLRHYLNTLVRQSGLLTEDEIAQWSGRKKVSQNAVYNHQSDRDVIAKLRDAVGDPSKSLGPFAKIDDRIFIRRDEFASIKVITAHTTEFGYCVHDYAQSPCQVHQDCIHCNEQVCVKGDARAEENLRKTQAELTQLQVDARAAFSGEVIGAAEWFAYHSKTLELVNQLVAILDDPEVPQGAVIQPSGVVPPSRLAMAEELRRPLIKSVSQRVVSLDDACALLTNASGLAQESIDGR